MPERDSELWELLMKDSFNNEAVDNSVSLLVRLLAVDGAECDLEAYIQSRNPKPKDGQ